MNNHSPSRLAVLLFLVASVLPLSSSVARAAEPFRISGQLIELSSTDLPATVVVRVNPAQWTDYVVTIGSRAELDDAMDAWITGDTLVVSGAQDAVTGVVTATAVQNVSLDTKKERAVNGWVKAIDAEASTVTITWQGSDTVISVTDKTRIVVPPLNPAKITDLRVGDRLRLRLAKGSANEAEIIMALRRGDEVFLKARTRPFRGTVIGVDAVRSLFSVRLKADPSLRADDVNNLVGVADEIVSVSYDSATKFLRTDGAPDAVANMGAGDGVFLVGRVGDDGVIAARLVHITDPVIGRHLVPIEGYTGIVTKWEPEESIVKVKLETGATWTVRYTGKTKMYQGASPRPAVQVEVGDHVIVKGTQNRQLYVIPATAIAVVSPAERPTAPVHPLKRVRPLADMIRTRIQAGLGKSSAADVVNAQASADAEETE